MSTITLVVIPGPGARTVNMHQNMTVAQLISQENLVNRDIIVNGVGVSANNYADYIIPTNSEVFATASVKGNGSMEFYTESSGSTAKEAFEAAVNQAKWESGNAGYTGTIAEKRTFSLASPSSLSSKEAYSLADSLILSDYSDKWGPAGCIPLLSNSNQEQRYLFFGWASY